MAQAVLLRLVRALHQQSSFDAPFFAVVRRNLSNEVIDYIRRRERRPEDLADPQDPTGQLRDEKRALAPDPADDLDVLGDERLRKALADLPQRDRDLMGARFWLGLSGPEIAARFDMSESNVNVRFHRAFEKLRRLLASDVTNKPNGTE